MQSLKEIHAWAQMQVPLFGRISWNILSVSLDPIVRLNALVDNNNPRDDIFNYHRLRECNIYILSPATMANK